DGLNLEYTFQIDYVHPFSDKVKLETGVKSVLRRIDSDYRTLVKANDGAEFEPVPLLTDLFFYDQDVFAGYVSFNLKLGDKWGLIAGTRYEHTDIRGEYQSELPNFKQNYDNWLPSIILNRKLSQFSNLKLSYNQRIQRPSLFFINPFTAINDPNNIQLGNPFLDPERVDQYEIAYNTFIKGIVINGAIFYRRTSDLIESFLTLADDGVTSETTYLNIGRSNNIGFNFFTSATIFKKLTLRGNFSLFRYDGTGSVDGNELERVAYQWNGFANGSLKLSETLRIDAFGFFRGNRQTLQGFNPAFGIFSLGLNKEFSKRTTMGIRIVEPFAENKPFESELIGTNFRQETFFDIPFRSFGISISHKFGQIDFRQQNRRSRVKNDDQKGGDNNTNF
ncbi:MAG: outer membrane beta-barrel family protein, partial [Bacteroidota bacterium]